jgi:purine-binding chemotaxis protein CheW
MTLGAHSVVIFTVSGQPFALSVEAVAEVVPIAWLAKPPGMPPIVQGVLNLGGAAVTILRSDLLLGVAPFPVGLDSSILIMRGGDLPLGLLVEQVQAVRPLSACRHMPIDDVRSFQGCVEAQLEVGELAVTLLSWPKLLLEEEKQRLAAFQDRMAERLSELADDMS